MKWLWKQRIKIFWLGVIWIITLPLGWVVYPHYAFYKVNMACQYIFWEKISVISRHVGGYGILRFNFGWITVPFTLFDEGLQAIIKHRPMQWNDVLWDWLGVLLGIGLSKVIKITIIKFWRKGDR